MDVLITTVNFHSYNMYDSDLDGIWIGVELGRPSKIVQPQIRGNMQIPSDGTTFSHNIKEDGNAIRTNGERPRMWYLFSGHIIKSILIQYH
jgi:hypothetical protein